MARKQKETTPVSASQSEVAPQKEREKGEERLADLLGGAGDKFEGEKIKLREVENDEVILVAFAFGKSKFKFNPETKEPLDFTIMQLEVDGELCRCSNGGQVIIDKLHRLEALMKEKPSLLPAPVVFFKEESKDGKSYWNMK